MLVERWLSCQSIVTRRWDLHFRESVVVMPGTIFHRMNSHWTLHTRDLCPD